MPLILSKPKPWIGCSILIIIAFTNMMLVSMLGTKETNIVLIIGITLGSILENNFELQTLFEGSLLAIMLVMMMLSLLTTSLPTTSFELITILIGLTVLLVTTTIILQWLIKNWICRFWGKGYGIVISAISIVLGIAGQSLMLH